MFIILVYLFSSLLDPPRLYVVPSRDTVMPGQLFTVAVHQFGDVGAVELDSGGLEVLTTEQNGATLYVWLRAAGPPRDVRVRAWGSGVEASAWVRVCCLEAPAAVGNTKRVFLPTVFH